MSTDQPHPLAQLAKEDQELVLELVLAGGSLKQVAEEYGVSYPTIRVRLDRVIERLRALVAGRRLDPLAELLARLVERGELSVANARAIRALAQESKSAGATPAPESGAPG